MLVLRPPTFHPGIVARVGSLSEAVLTLSGFALVGSRSPDVAAWVKQELPLSRLLSPIGRIAAAYHGLPTRYVADGVDDLWQYVWWTLLVKTGDCEDSSTALAAILSYLGIDARIAVMPGHAAVVIPVDVDDWGRRSIGGWILPSEWTTFFYAGGQWLGLETTLRLRAVPGEGTHMLWQAAAVGTLSIGPSMGALLRSLTVRPPSEGVLSRAFRLRRSRRSRSG